jgi:hypothetical protein
MPQVLENWYPTPEEGKDKGVLLVVTSGKEGAISGGKNFMTVSGHTRVIHSQATWLWCVNPASQVYGTYWWCSVYGLTNTAGCCTWC